MLDVTYHGHAAFQLSDGSRTVLLDPWFSGNPKAVVPVAKLPKIDALLVTHGHGDHLGDAVELSKAHKAVIVAPFELAMFCQRRGALVHPMNHGGKFKFPFGTVKLTQAVHSSAFVDKGAEYTGNPCGFLVEMGGLTVYFAGDTALFSDMKLLGELHPIDIAFLPIGDNFTMGPEDAAVATRLLAPRHVIPMHFGTFEVLEPTADRFLSLVAPLPAQAVALAPGETRRFA